MQQPSLRPNLREDARSTICIRVQHESSEARHRSGLQSGALRHPIAQEQVEKNFVLQFLFYRFFGQQLKNPFPRLLLRAGTNVDSENLSNTLRNLHFEVSIYKDFKNTEMMDEIREGLLRW